MFNDDVVLHNNSAFGLTNVKAKVWIRQGERTWNADVNCKSISAGGGCKAENVVSVPNNHYDEMKIIAFDCDQYLH